MAGLVKAIYTMSVILTGEDAEKVLPTLNYGGAKLMITRTAIPKEVWDREPEYKANHPCIVQCDKTHEHWAWFRLDRGAYHVVTPIEVIKARP